MSQYQVRDGKALGWNSRWIVVDTDNWRPVAGFEKWDDAFDEANLRNNPSASGRPAGVAAPCCDCAEKAERYRHALAQILRYSADATATRYAETALSVQERITRANDAV